MDPSPAAHRLLPCNACGYDLRGRRVGDRCPECGRSVPFLELSGGLAAGGALRARPAARLGWLIAVLSVLASFALYAVLAQAASQWMQSLFALVWLQSRVVTLVLGAWLCALVARMLPRDSAWSRAMWLAMAVRIVWGGLFEASVVARAPTGTLLFVADAEMAVSRALDLLVALAVLRIAPTGGLSRRSAIPAMVAVAASVLGCVVSRMRLDLDAWSVASIPLRSGAIGAVGCAASLWRIKRELHAD